MVLHATGTSGVNDLERYAYIIHKYLHIKSVCALALITYIYHYHVKFQANNKSVSAYSELKTVYQLDAGVRNFTVDVACCLITASSTDSFPSMSSQS